MPIDGPVVLWRLRKGDHDYVCTARLLPRGVEMAFIVDGHVNFQRVFSDGEAVRAEVTW